MAHITMAVPPRPCPPLPLPHPAAGFGRQRLNRALESLFTFTPLVFRTKQGAWHKRIQLMKGSDFLSSGTTNSVAIQHFHTYNFARITVKEPVCLEGWNCKFSVPIWSPWEPNLTHRRQLSLTEGESDFLPLPVFFLGVSSVIADITRVFAIRASCFYISRENLGEASQACYESTLISGTSFFSQ